MKSDIKTDLPELEAIARRVAAGDQQSFRSLFDMFAGRLTAFAHSILHSREAATEVVDDVLVSVWKNRDRLLRIENLRTYLYTATKNTALNYLSRKARQLTTEPFDDLHVAIHEAVTPEQIMITGELFRKIQAAVEALPPRCKMVFKLVREDGLKYQEVADILNVSVNTVDAQMVIAVKKLKDVIGEGSPLFSTQGAEKV